MMFLGEGVRGTSVENQVWRVKDGGKTMGEESEMFDGKK